MADTVKGSCLCGKVRITIDGKLRDVLACHCTQCRKQSGHHFAATDAADANLTVEGTQNVTWYAASNTAKRGFCSTCGSVLFWKRNGSENTSIMAGCFEPGAGLQLSAHIFVADKGDYYQIKDGLPQFERTNR